MSQVTLGQRVRFKRGDVLEHRIAPGAGGKRWVKIGELYGWSDSGEVVDGIIVGIRNLREMEMVTVPPQIVYDWRVTDEDDLWRVANSFNAYVIATDLRRKHSLVEVEDVDLGDVEE